MNVDIDFPYAFKYRGFKGRIEKYRTEFNDQMGGVHYYDYYVSWQPDDPAYPFQPTHQFFKEGQTIGAMVEYVKKFIDSFNYQGK